MAEDEYRKKLIEVALPLDVINTNAGKEKNIHVGLLSNMHVWWSRKPLGVARAVLFSSIVDDTGNDDTRRSYLFDLIEKLSSPENMDDPKVLEAARDEISKVLGSNPADFWDPFSGGGSLPLEAFRLGLNSRATDINPVSVFLNRVIALVSAGKQKSRTIPKKLFDPDNLSFEIDKDVEKSAERILNRVKRRHKSAYPTVNLPSNAGGDAVAPVAWIWARTVICPNPACRCVAPLVNKFWLSTHTGNEAFVEPHPLAGQRRVEFRIMTGKGKPRSGTVTKKGGTCLMCDQPIPFQYIRAEGVEGRLSRQLLAIVAEKNRRRYYIEPQNDHQEAAESCASDWAPDTELPKRALGFRVQGYGIAKHAELFTPRQLSVIDAFCEELRIETDELRARHESAAEYVDLLQVILALAVSRLAQTNNVLVRWLVRKSGTSKGTPAFDRQIVSMVWEFSEGNPFGTSVGSWRAAIKNSLGSLKSVPSSERKYEAKLFDCTDRSESGLSDVIVSTDPPYFDNIGYADLSDFFYIWLRRCLRGQYPDIFSTMLTPKLGDITYQLGGDSSAIEKKAAFQNGMISAFSKIKAATRSDIPLTIYYAFKQHETTGQGDEAGLHSSGWETLLDSIIAAGLQITATWPLRTESATRIRAIGSNALASSIVLACRKASMDAAITTRAEFIKALRRELPEALRMLQKGNIAPVDLAQASIGPGMSVFTQYSKVLEADDTRMTVKTALQLINAALDEFLSEQEAEYDPHTRFAITWFETHAMDAATYGAAETLATARNVSVGGVAEAGLVEARGGKVRLLSRGEMPAGWDPANDSHPTVWEATQQLICSLEEDGEQAAADLLRRLGSRADPARDLAYRLHRVCERMKWAEEGLSYNSLIIAWPELRRLAQMAPEDLLI